VQGPAATGHVKRKPEPHAAVGALKFAQCMRDNGVKDFPDPPMVRPSSTRIESIHRIARWYEHSRRRDAEVPRFVGSGSEGPVMRRKTWALAAAAVLAVATVTGGVLVISGPKQQALAAQQAPAHSGLGARAALRSLATAPQCID
jgi:hypothetical protein